MVVYDVFAEATQADFPFCLGVFLYFCFSSTSRLEINDDHSGMSPSGSVRKGDINFEEILSFLPLSLPLVPARVAVVAVAL